VCVKKYLHRAFNRGQTLWTKVENRKKNIHSARLVVATNKSSRATLLNSSISRAAWLYVYAFRARSKSKEGLPRSLSNIVLRPVTIAIRVKVNTVEKKEEGSEREWQKRLGV